MKRLFSLVIVGFLFTSCGSDSDTDNGNGNSSGNGNNNQGNNDNQSGTEKDNCSELLEIGSSMEKYLEPCTESLVCDGLKFVCDTETHAWSDTVCERVSKDAIRFSIMDEDMSATSVKCISMKGAIKLALAECSDGYDTVYEVYQGVDTVDDAGNRVILECVKENRSYRIGQCIYGKVYLAVDRCVCDESDMPGVCAGVENYDKADEIDLSYCTCDIKSCVPGYVLKTENNQAYCACDYAINDQCLDQAHAIHWIVNSVSHIADDNALYDETPAKTSCGHFAEALNEFIIDNKALLERIQGENIYSPNTSDTDYQAAKQAYEKATSALEFCDVPATCSPDGGCSAVDPQDVIQGFYALGWSDDYRLYYNYGASD